MLWLLPLLMACREPMGPAPGPVTDLAPVAWERLLARIVDVDGDVDYERLAQDRDALDGYLRWMQRPSALRETGDAHSFWLNAFNALVLYQVIERDVRESVNEVPSRLPWEGSRFWYGTEFVVLGEPMSLWEIGHERVTHTTQDYRDFAALPLAARSGPFVLGELYQPRSLDAQLEAQMRRLLQSDRGLRFGLDGEVLFNPMLDRYALEFDLTFYGLDLCTMAAIHTEGERHERLLAAADQGCPHGFFPFDWSLNRSAR